jgi:hypothetical protein
MHLQRALVRVPREPDDPRNLVGVFEGRAWLNLSALRGYLSGASVRRWVEEVEPTLAGHVRDRDLPATDDLRRPDVLPGLVFQSARAMAAAVAGQLQPQRSAASARSARAHWLDTLERRATHVVDERGLVAWVDHLLAPTAALVAGELMPRIALATTARRAIRDPFAHRRDCALLLDATDRGVEGHRVTEFLAAAPTDRAALFAHWGPRALDIVQLRFGSQAGAPAWPAVDAPAFQAAFAQARQARRLACSTLASELTGPLERARFLAAAEVIEALGGLSDWPLDALLRCLQPIRRVLRELAADAEAAGHLAPGAWGDLRLADFEQICQGRRPQPSNGSALPGADLRKMCPPQAGVLVAGPFKGRMVDIGTPSPVPASETIWVTERLDLQVAAQLSACAGVVVTGEGAHGPALTAATVLGRPCVFAPRDALPPTGSRVQVDRAGTVSVCVD